MKKIILVALLGATFLYAESSAFDAGNLTSNSAYGLTNNEKKFKEKLDALSHDYAQVNASINQTNERLEGLQSTLEGVNSQYVKSTSRLIRLEEVYDDLDNNLTQEIQALRVYVEESRKIQEANNKQVKKILAELSSLVDSINSNYISKSEYQDKILTLNSKLELDNNLSEINQSLPNVVQAKSKEEPKPKLDESWKKKKNSEILELAVAEMNKNSYAQAQVKFEYLVAKHHKPARVNFYLGELEYKQKNYNNAIAYYKKSSAISTKGDYFPKLLYHTAISLDKIGDTKSANRFYKALKTNYPKSSEAKASPNRK